MTPELVKEALKTSHESCEGSGGCIHADAISGIAEDFKLFIASVGLAALTSPNPLEFTIYTAIHVGYRMRQLEEAADKTGKVLVN